MAAPSSPLSRALAAAEIAGAAAALARARQHLEAEPDAETRTLLDYVQGWVNRALVECVEPEPSAPPTDPRTLD